MVHARARRGVGLMALAVGTAMVLGSAGVRVASAQQVMRMAVTTGSGLSGMSRPAMSSKELVSYAAILGLDEAQTEAAKMMLATYTAEFEKASKEQATKMQQISEEFRETRDDSVWEQMGPVSEKFRKRSKELEAGLLSDLKAICSDAQTAQWPKMERTRRRDRTIERGSVSGESVDLVRIVSGLELKPEAAKELKPQIEAYEQDLDRVLIERNKIMDEQAESFRPGGGPMNFDIEKFQEQLKQAREAGEKVRDVNQRYARAIQSLLPQALQADFEAQVKRASFPMVYKQSRTERALDAALKFEDLDERQKEAVASLRSSYIREAETLNDRWAAAIVDEEKEAGGGMALGNGGAMMISFGGEEDDSKPSAQARKARREFDKKSMQSLESLLTEEQRERLPVGAGESVEREGAPMIFRAR